MNASQTPALQQIPKVTPLPTDSHPLVLIPFPDGTCLKLVKRAFPGDTAPTGYDQHILVNVVGDQLAITKNQAIAHLICDAVNMLFAAQARNQEEAAALVNAIAPTQDLISTQH